MSYPTSKPATTAEFVHASQAQWLALNPGWTPRPIEGEAPVVAPVSSEGR